MNPFPFHQMAENPALLSNILRRATLPTAVKPSKSNFHGGGLFRIFKLLPMLTAGSKMAALLVSIHRKPLLADKATTITLFGYRKGRLAIAIQENPHQPPIFLLELPMSTAVFHREMASDVLRIAIESETKTRKKKLMEEFVWAVYCNCRKLGCSIRRKNMSDDEIHVMNLLRGVSMGAGVLPSLWEKERAEEGQLTYIRARFDRVVGSKDSESFYMINPEGASGQELIIFFVRVKYNI
ncbi:protein MIZU-KUSSEI 1-like [Primulina eburnea]|uniref:protein MIZU-KUSSEI 1-like n=1 Tax=Primulina eburnea TaxID=1245227 RepID=UPI003C6BE67E